MRNLMRFLKNSRNAFLAFAAAALMQSCIHEYPVMTSSSGIGERPGEVVGYIELSYDLSWEEMIHTIYFSTKAASGKTHRFVVEVEKDGVEILHDVVLIDDNEFATGKLRRKLSQPLKAERYEIAAWYDRIDENDNAFFNADNLRKIRITNTSTVESRAFDCGYCSDELDLRSFGNEKKTVETVKTMELQLSCGRFELVATDVQQFITEQKEALNQDDKFTVFIEFPDEAKDVFNAFSGSCSRSGDNYSLSGRMRLPFADYDELSIAQGLVFCKGEENIRIKLSVKNSALSTVSQTEIFSIPVRTGFNTIVKGEFLVNPLDGFFNINHIWEDEIYYEI